MTMTKAQDQRSHSMKEQAYNKDKVQEQDSRTQRQDNLKDLASRDIHGEVIYWHLQLLSATLVYCDNVSAIYMTANPVQHQWTKHIEIDKHIVRDMIARGQVHVLHVPSRYQYADIFTKGLLSAFLKNLVPGTVLNKVDREIGFNNAFDQFIAEPGESLIYLTTVPYDDLFDYLQQFEKIVIASREKKLKAHDPLALVCYSTPTNNRLRSSSNTRSQAVVQADKVNIQSRNVKINGRSARRLYNEDTAEGINVQKETKNDSKYFMEPMLLVKKDETRVILSNKQNDFLLTDTIQMEELKELSANICMMARIQPVNIYSDEFLSYDYAFISEVQTPSTSYVNPLFTDDDHEQMYHEQPKIINSTIGEDQINSNIIFDDPNVKVNNGSVDHDKYVHDLYELEQLARNAYKEAEKQ
ncbi:reverse transcriptase domain-containing protein [Tanacetum coccineum]